MTHRLMGTSVARLIGGVLLVLAANLAWADILYIHSDHLNTPRLATNEQGGVLWRNLPTSEPFGNSPVEEDPDGDTTLTTLNQRFPGQYYDKETNTHYNYFRDYDPSTGRYVQSDPVGLRGGVNTYSYVGGNPLNWRDPFGLAIGDFPPPPPGYDPRTWRTGQWDDGRWFLEDPSRKTTYTCHPEDKGHWRHWDKDGDDDGRWPPNSKKPWPGQKRAPYGDQSASDPSGNAPPWQPPTQFSDFPGVPFVPLPNGPLPSMPPVRVPLVPILVP